jgi:hypothetical protein
LLPVRRKKSQLLLHHQLRRHKLLLNSLLLKGLLRVNKHQRNIQAGQNSNKIVR